MCESVCSGRYRVVDVPPAALGRRVVLRSRPARLQDSNGRGVRQSDAGQALVDVLPDQVLQHRLQRHPRELVRGRDAADPLPGLLRRDVWEGALEPEALDLAPDAAEQPRPEQVWQHHVAVTVQRGERGRRECRRALGCRHHRRSASFLLLIGVVRGQRDHGPGAQVKERVERAGVLGWDAGGADEGEGAAVVGEVTLLRRCGPHRVIAATPNGSERPVVAEREEAAAGDQPQQRVAAARLRLGVLVDRHGGGAAA